MYITCVVMLGSIKIKFNRGAMILISVLVSVPISAYHGIVVKKYMAYQYNIGIGTNIDNVGILVKGLLTNIIVVN